MDRDGAYQRLLNVLVAFRKYGGGGLAGPEGWSSWGSLVHGLKPVAFTVVPLARH
jgi:hypothetical protein